MNLLIDIGNTRIKWTLCSDSVAGDDVASCAASISVEEFGRDVTSALTDKRAKIESVWISSVGRVDFVERLVEWARQHWRVEANVVAVSRSGFGIQNGYDDTTQMGVDRWVALVGARHYCPDRPVVVVDAGTAITIDTLDHDGSFIGGLILPGAALARRALLSNTDRINEAEDTESTGLSPFGKNTGECVHRGSRFAAIGGVGLALDSVTNALRRAPEVIVCGGDADTMALHLGERVTCRPWLVLEGLALMAAPR